MYLIRLLIVGESGVGKTSLLQRFNEGSFMANQKTTIGVDYRAKEVEIDGTQTKLQIWDTAGQERFRSMTSAFYLKAQGVVLTFDVEVRKSFLELPSWIGDVRRDAPEGCVLILCANKADIEQERWKVKREEFEAFALEHGFQVFECSGKSGANVQELFVELGRQVLATCKDLRELGEGNGPASSSSSSTSRDSIVLFDVPQEKKKSRCGGGKGCVVS